MSLNGFVDELHLRNLHNLDDWHRSRKSHNTAVGATCSITGADATYWCTVNGSSGRNWSSVFGGLRDNVDVNRLRCGIVLISATYMRKRRRSCRSHCHSRRSRRLAAGARTRAPSDLAPVS